MDITDGTTFAEQFRNGQPDNADGRWRSTPHALIAPARAAIDRSGRQGSSWENIARHFGWPDVSTSARDRKERSARPSIANERKKTLGVRGPIS